MAKRKYVPAVFTQSVEKQLREMQRQQLAKPAADKICELLGVLFAYSPDVFSDSVKDAVIQDVKRKMPGSLEAWMEHWPAKERYTLEVKRAKLNEEGYA